MTDNQQRLQNISHLLYQRRWENLTVYEQKDVIANWEHPFWARNDRCVDALKKGEKVILV